jgi:hypothetical protein
MRHYFFLKKERKVAIWKGIFVPITIILFSDHLKCSSFGLLMLSACQMKQCMECASGDCLLCLYVNYNIYAPTVLSQLSMIWDTISFWRRRGKLKVIIWKGFLKQQGPLFSQIRVIELFSIRSKNFFFWKSDFFHRDYVGSFLSLTWSLHWSGKSY